MVSVTLYNDDCLNAMKILPDSSIDAIITDLPYGTTYCKWDTIISLDQMWLQVKRVLKKNRPFVTTSDQPFTSILIASNLKWFRHNWVWNKVNATNFANCNHQPMKIHEDIVVFAQGKTTYNPQKTTGKANHAQGSSRLNKSETRKIEQRVEDDFSGMKFPKSIQEFAKHSSQCGLHPTQKPVELYEFLINTYTNEGDVVLDIAMGSGTTGVACANTGRNFIGMETTEEYFRLAEKRIADAQLQLPLLEVA